MQPTHIEMIGAHDRPKLRRIRRRGNADHRNTRVNGSLDDGFDGIAISLIGQNNPVGVCAAALFFGALRAGGTRMQLLGVHKSFPELIQGLALLFVAMVVDALLRAPTV